MGRLSQDRIHHTQATRMLRREKKGRERKRLLEAGKRFCRRRCTQCEVQPNQGSPIRRIGNYPVCINNNINRTLFDGESDKISNDGWSLGEGGKRGSLVSMTHVVRDVDDLVPSSRLSLLSLQPVQARRGSRASLPGYTSLSSETNSNSLSSQLIPSPYPLRRKSLTSLGEVDETDSIDGNEDKNNSQNVCDKNTKYQSTSYLEKRCKNKNPTGCTGRSRSTSRLSLIRRFSFRKKTGEGGSTTKSPSKITRITLQKRSSSTPFNSSFFVKPKPERRLSSLIRRKSKGSGSDFSMGSILQRALMPPGIDEATRAVFRSSQNSKQRRNAVFEVNPDERHGLKVFLSEHVKAKQDAKQG